MSTLGFAFSHREKESVRFSNERTREIKLRFAAIIISLSVHSVTAFLV
jgi:hypothetical protein